MLNVLVPENPVPAPDLYSHEISSGDVLYAMVLRPYNAVPGQKYPTVLNVYGGPEVQVVTNTFKVLFSCIYKIFLLQET